MKSGAVTVTLKQLPKPSADQLAGVQKMLEQVEEEEHPKGQSGFHSPMKAQVQGGHFLRTERSAGRKGRREGQQSATWLRRVVPGEPRGSESTRGPAECEMTGARVKGSSGARRGEDGGG